MAAVNIVLGDDQTEGTKATINQWLYKEGDFVEINQPIVELETDKVMMEIIAPASGQLSKILLNSGDEVNSGKTLGVIDTDKQGQNSSTEASKTPSTDVVFNENDGGDSDSNHIAISPAVRRLLKENSIQIGDLRGTGKGGRVTSRDIHKYLNDPQLRKQKIDNRKNSEHLPISTMRKSIAKHMVESLLHTAPHVTSVFNLDLSSIIAHRKKHKDEYLEQGINLTFTTYFIAASAIAIKQQPLINAQLHTDSIEVFNNINIGIGTALADKGLIVPVLKNCENKNLLSIAQDLTRLTNKARAGELKPNDVKDGTFTISNHGVSGSLIATPIIINQPQSAILGIGKMEKRVVVKETDSGDVMMIRPMCYVTLTIDHRILDAHQCNHFLSVFVEALEKWPL
jgi:2-oxoglutarate dehydrogenase E2 component (dihydrolipoamide succinyltransferase)